MTNDRSLRVFLDANILIRGISLPRFPYEVLRHAAPIRFRAHRDFHFMLCQLIPYNARLWLQGWLEGLSLGETARQEDELDDDELGFGSAEFDQLPF